MYLQLPVLLLELKYLEIYNSLSLSFLNCLANFGEVYHELSEDHWNNKFYLLTFTFLSVRIHCLIFDEPL